MVSAGNLTAEQRANANTIIAVCRSRHLPDRAAVIAVATAAQESSLVNLHGGDRDSVGLFQQRPSQGWGTAEQCENPVYATGKFLDGLVKVPGWQSMPVTVAAQTVQQSAYPSAYAKWVPLAEELVGGSGSTDATMPTTSTTDTGSSGGLDFGSLGNVWKRLALFALGCLMVLMALIRMTK